jgi:hypothetical protein
MISPVEYLGDLSDELSDAQQTKIITDLFHISYSCLRLQSWPANGWTKPLRGGENPQISV